MPLAVQIYWKHALNIIALFKQVNVALILPITVYCIMYLTPDVAKVDFAQCYNGASEIPSTLVSWTAK